MLPGHSLIQQPADLCLPACVEQYSSYLACGPEINGVCVCLLMHGRTVARHRITQQIERELVAVPWSWASPLRTDSAASYAVRTLTAALVLSPLPGRPAS